MRLKPNNFTASDIIVVLASGWRVFRAIPGASMAFSVLFVVIGLILLGAIGKFGISPMALPFAGGFMLVGPVLLTGYLHLANLHAAGRRPQLMDAFVAFSHAPLGLWLLAGLCAFLFLIWITDAAVLYSFMIGGEYLPYDLPWLISLQRHVLAFELWGSLMGSVLAYIIFAISAFSVPLLDARRATLVQAVYVSVRAILGNFVAALLWGLVLAGITLLAIMLLPLLVVVLPVLAYASHALYKKVFPLVEEETG